MHEGTRTPHVHHGNLTPGPVLARVGSTRDRGSVTHWRGFGRPPFAEDPRCACRQTGVDPDWWFAPKGDEWSSASQRRLVTNRTDAARAKVICRRCPLLEVCRDYALDAGEPFGVWGGLDADERRDLRRAAP